MRALFRTAIVVLALTGSATAAAAQGIIPIAVEGRGALALPQGDWDSNNSINTGYGYGFNIRVQLFPLISAYGGWDRYNFGVSGSGNADASDAGMHLGGQISLPTGWLIGVSPFAFAGLVFNRTEMPVGNSSITTESDREIGYEVGAGLAFPFIPAVTLTPQIRYRSHGAEFSAGAGERIDTTISYFSFDVGVRLGI